MNDSLAKGWRKALDAEKTLSEELKKTKAELETWKEKFDDSDSGNAELMVANMKAMDEKEKIELENKSLREQLEVLKKEIFFL